MPGNVGFGIRTFCNALASSICERVCLLAMQHTVALNHVIHVARGATNRVHQARLCVCAKLGLEVVCLQAQAEECLPGLEEVAVLDPVQGPTVGIDQILIANR